MPKFILALAAAVLFSTSVYANVITVKFEPTEGDAVTFAFDTEANTSTNVATGETGPYTFDEAANKICGAAPDGSEVCATFDGPAGEPKVGDSGAYTTNTGTAGTATIVSIE
ncbi:MAG: hypothetical protein RLO08_16925 [Parvibaculaceae bacterium]